LPSATCSAASIHFAELVNTTYGENIVVTGSIPALGSWSPAAGVVLNANAYTAASPLWQGDASGIDPGEVFQYKYVVVGTDG
jgi:alpha-amylase